ncbi:hypothetical protein LPB72_04355 [Hydrogenophaga crassostreae]|uniref:Uncharacterized protein n=1 Tax=Hydrogenophaga crassostreae TaxID=1763535 RepID=A0ABX2UAW5_9BURK|nr:hypothetical protein LPB72_04355 [Hydrogenophaga crassostreae]
MAIHDRRPRGCVQIKIFHENVNARSEQTHAFDEALLVIDGVINPNLCGQVESIKACQVYTETADLPYAVTPGNHGSLVTIDR